MDKELNRIKKALTKRTRKRGIPYENLLSTGSTLLNLATLGRRSGGFAKGMYFHLVGDSNSGKTWLSFTCLAEAVLNPHFQNYRFIFDNAENGALMDIRRFFGKEVARRLEPPSRDKHGEPVYSSTIEELIYHIDDAFNDGRPFIYILDSIDALSSKEEEKQLAKDKRASRTGKTVTGSMGMSKAKKLSASMRVINARLRKSGSILIAISQTRDNVGWTMEAQPKTYSGGRALIFYAQLQIWTSVAKSIQKKISAKKKLQQGTLVRARVKKNRMAGRDRTVCIPIYHSYGIDDLGSCVDYLLEWGHWKKRGGVIDATDLELSGKREDLIHQIEEGDREEELRALVGQVWNQLEEKVALKRKRRYQ